MSESTQQDLAFDWGGITLTGTLHLPSSDEIHPAVVMMQGSGPADRDADGYFPPIRETFVARRIATFAFDKPGCGNSTGDWRDFAMEDRADQVVAALDVLGEHPEIEAAAIGIWGQSQGGWLVQMLASRMPDLAFAIANSGPSLNVRQQDFYGCEHMMRAQGHSESDIESALEFIGALYEAGRRGADYATVDAQLLQAARGQPWYGYASVDDAADWSFGLKLATERFEPRDVMARIRCPFLAIYGGRDVLLPPWQGAEETGRALEQSGNPDATVVVFPAGDHRIRDNAGEFVPGYLDLLGDWTAALAGRGLEDATR